jgi:hypothetical protein
VREAPRVAPGRRRRPNIRCSGGSCRLSIRRPRRPGARSADRRRLRLVTPLTPVYSRWSHSQILTRCRASNTRSGLALPSREIPQRGDLGRNLLPLLGWSAPSRPVRCWRLLRLAGAGFVALAHGDDALPLDGLYGEAATSSRPADGGAQATGVLPLHERHPHGLASGDLGEEGGHGGIRLARLLLLQGDCESARGARTYDQAWRAEL